MSTPLRFLFLKVDVKICDDANPPFDWLMNFFYPMVSFLLNFRMDGIGIDNIFKEDRVIFFYLFHLHDNPKIYLLYSNATL